MRKVLNGWEFLIVMADQISRESNCSGFVSILYEQVYGRQLSRSSADMLKHDCRKIFRDELKEGDLVFFRDGRWTEKESQSLRYLP